MPTISEKKLQAVAHDIGHHAHSGLSYIHPHLGQLAAQSARTTVSVDLMVESPYPAGLPDHEPLRRALCSLGATTKRVLTSYGYDGHALRSLILKCTFLRPDDYYVSVTEVQLVSASGRQFFARFGPP